MIINGITLGVWRLVHRSHGLGRGPYYETKVHVWHIHRCGCGERFYVPEGQHEHGDKATGEVRP